MLLRDLEFSPSRINLSEWLVDLQNCWTSNIHSSLPLLPSYAYQIDVHVHDCRLFTQKQPLRLGSFVKKRCQPQPTITFPVRAAFKTIPSLASRLLSLDSNQRMPAYGCHLKHLNCSSLDQCSMLNCLDGCAIFGHSNNENARGLKWFSWRSKFYGSPGKQYSSCSTLMHLR